nr:hypothetical protein [Micromonospora sp. DSM 115978]
MVNLGALTGLILLGFLAGLFSFRVKSRWCPRCGEMTVPPADRPPSDGTGPAGRDR